MFGSNVLYMSVKCIGIMTSASALLSFCLADLSIGKSQVLNCPTISLWGLMCDLNFSNVSFTFVCALVFGTYMYRFETSS